MHWAGEQVLLTSAGGFCGSQLVERLLNLEAWVRYLVHYNSRNDWRLLQLLPRALKRETEVVPRDIIDSFSAHLRGHLQGLLLDAPLLVKSQGGVEVTMNLF